MKKSQELGEPGWEPRQELHEASPWLPVSILDLGFLCWFLLQAPGGMTLTGSWEGCRDIVQHTISTSACYPPLARGPISNLYVVARFPSAAVDN